MNDSAPDLQDAGQYLQLWADVLAQAMGEISGSPCPATVLTQAPEGSPPGEESDLWMLAGCSGALRGELSLRLPQATTLRLAQVFMSEAPNPAASISPEHRESVVELFRQVAGLAATATKTGHGEVHVRLEVSPAAPSWPASMTAWLRIGEDAPNLIEIQLSAALIAALRSGDQAGSAEAVPSSLHASTAPPAVPPAIPHDGKVNLDLLLDVELGVTLRFGSRRLLLREVLDINPGSVIGLDRQVDEPADMLLDGRVVARGEVVVLDGNYGFRVTEISCSEQS